MDGPVFAAPDDRRVLSRAMTRELQRIDDVARAPKREGWNTEPIRLLGRTLWRRTIRVLPDRAAVVQRYVRAARDLPRDPENFERYRAVWHELIRTTKAEYPRRMVVVPEKRPGHLRGLSLGGFGDEWHAERVLRGEAERRVLAHAIALRRGERPEPPRDPYGPGPLTVRDTATGRIIASKSSTARTLDGKPFRPPTPDFSATIPR